MDIEKVYFAASDITEVYLSPDGEVETVYLSNSDIIEVIFAEHAGDPLTGAVKTVNDTPPNAAGNVDVTFSTIRGYPEVRKATDYLNAQGEFKPISIGGASSASIYMSNEDSAVAGYKKLNYTPDAAETVKTITANNSTVAGEAYLMDDPLNTTIFDAGTWFFNYFRSVSSSAQESFKGLDVFVRHANGTETLLFSLESASIEDTVLTERQVTYPQQAFSVALTDRLGVRSKFRTTRNAATVLSYVVGGARGWGMRTPLAIDHNNTRNKNANPDFQHITLAEKTQGALATGNSTLDTVKKVADRVDRLLVDFTVPVAAARLEFVRTDAGILFADLDIKSIKIIAYFINNALNPILSRIRINDISTPTYKNTGNIADGILIRSYQESVSYVNIDILGDMLMFDCTTVSSSTLINDSTFGQNNFEGRNNSTSFNQIKKISIFNPTGGINILAGSIIKIYRND